MKMDFLYKDIKFAPKEIQEAKELWLKGDEASQQRSK